MTENQNLVQLDATSFEAAVLNDFGLEIKNSSRVEKGYSSQVYRAELDGQVVFIRINKNKNVFEAEELGYKIFEENRIPVPKIIAYKENPLILGFPTMIMTSAVGKTLKESNLTDLDSDLVYKEIGQILRKIHQTKLSGYGQLRVENGELVGQFLNWREYSEFQDSYNMKALAYCIDNNFISITEAEKIKEIYKEIILLDFGKASFLHRDINQGHFFVDGPHITGIIDLGSIMAGDPRYDIAMALVFAPDERKRQCIKKGYGDLANDPMVSKYIITIVVRKIFFRSKEEIKGKVDLLTPFLNEFFNK